MKSRKSAACDSGCSDEVLTLGVASECLGQCLDCDVTVELGIAGEIAPGGPGQALKFPILALSFGKVAVSNPGSGHDVVAVNDLDDLLCATPVMPMDVSTFALGASAVASGKALTED